MTICWWGSVGLAFRLAWKYLFDNFLNLRKGHGCCPFKVVTRRVSRDSIAPCCFLLLCLFPSECFLSAKAPRNLHSLPFRGLPFLLNNRNFSVLPSPSAPNEDSTVIRTDPYWPTSNVLPHYNHTRKEKNSKERHTAGLMTFSYICLVDRVMSWF